VVWNTVAGVVRPPRVVILRGNESESNGGSGKAPTCCVIVVATARQPTRGSVSAVSLRQVEGGVVAAQRRRVPHAGGLSDAVQSASFGSLST
jgi:hypothetical protein